MLRYARSAHSAYREVLEDEKKCEIKEKIVLPEKGKAKAQIKILKPKKQKLSRDVSLDGWAFMALFLKLFTKIYN